MTDSELHPKTKRYLQWLTNQPAWIANLLIFGLLIGIITAYFFWQIHQSNQNMIQHVREYAAMIAGVIEVNAHSAVLSQDAVEQIMRTFLGNTARFIEYLDAVEPFAPEELASFSLESGLAGIRIIRQNGQQVEGLEKWRQVLDQDCGTNGPSLQRLSSEHLYTFTYKSRVTLDCIIVGLVSESIEKIQDELGLSQLLKTISGLSGIHQVYIETQASPDTELKQVVFFDDPEGTFAKTRIPFGKDYLVVALKMTHFKSRMTQLRQESIAFSVILACLGVFFSWILHHIQRAYLHRIQTIERDMAKQREDAALGRAAATITHEIRNPLNAISMGLQRLLLEADDLSGEYRTLVSSLLKAVQRANRIVSDMRRYSGPLTLHKQQFHLNAALDHILHLYQPKFTDSGITIQTDIRCVDMIACDPDMMAEVIENLVKNAVEAQPNGGFIRIVLEKQESDMVFSIENSGFNADVTNPEQILEPYYTTRSKGTGLGLTIVQRIVQAHNGRLSIQRIEPDILKMILYLPITDLT